MATTELDNAINLTRPDGIQGVRFVKNPNGLYNWYSQDLEEGTTLLTAEGIDSDNVLYISGLLTARGWR